MEGKGSGPQQGPLQGCVRAPVSQRVAFLSSGLWMLDFQLQNVKGAQHGCWWLTPPHLWLKRPGLCLSGPGGQDAAWAFWISSLWDHHHPGMPLLLAVTPKKGAGTGAAIAPSVPAAPSAVAAGSRDRGTASPSWWPRVLCHPLSSHEAGSASPSRSKETQ